ncbi:caspase family protein [Streptomyces prunicolor]|uniref:caspase family protein n=1 Tax=Streptomyces prunicolor TaxID=67348 RepID=UPI00035E2EB4|nr:caspase family protein [Streptomyces prunicolor]
MTVYRIDDGPDPRIHALVIGVGEYPNCGDKARPGTPPYSLLRPLRRELTCAPLSAMHVARWLIEADWSASAVKLGTVDVLLSPDCTVPWWNEPMRSRPKRAVYANVKEAWQRWVNTCDQHSGNIALLYFCGHGWGGGQKYLLVEDLAEDIANWQDRVIDFNRTRQSMRACRALTQCFFLDTCSNDPTDLAPWDIRPPHLIDDNQPEAESRQLDRETRANNPIYTPTPKGFGSRVQASKVTPFADALVRTLNGLGATHEGAHWEVRTRVLYSKFADVLDFFSPGVLAGNDLAPPRSDFGRDTVLRRCPAPPMVPFRLDCSPASALPRAHWELRCLQTGAQHFHGPEPRKWEGKTPASAYDITVDCKDGIHKLTQPGRTITPARFITTIPI